MENSISYFAGGKQFNFFTPLKFGDQTDEQIAVKVFILVSADRNTRLKNGEIPISLSDKEKQSMTDAEIAEWYFTSNIEFVDYACKKKLLMHHMSDIQGYFKVEPIE